MINHLQENLSSSLHRCKNGTIRSEVLCSQGIHIELFTAKNGNGYLKIILNPRVLIDHDAGYLGIMPKGKEPLKKLKYQFQRAMKEIHAPYSIDQYLLTRLDLCVNFTGYSGDIKQYMRMIWKQNAPATYTRYPFKSEKLSNKENRQRDRHYFRIANKNVEYVVYDKGFQATKEGLRIGYLKLPKGLLRFEVHLMRDYIRSLEKQWASNDILSFLHLASQNSADVISRYTDRVYPSGKFVKYTEQKEIINRSGYSDKTKEQMLCCIRHTKSGSLPKALSKLKRHFNLHEKDCASLLKRFEYLEIQPIPLRKNYRFDTLPDILSVMQLLQVHDSYTLE
ncbi:MAG: hypothetical protein PHE09_16780 [Oscillospiraceae bacterium]|nr:hypothetical protein [Oscillospiraceae bacterium]